MIIYDNDASVMGSTKLDIGWHRTLDCVRRAAHKNQPVRYGEKFASFIHFTGRASHIY